MNKLAVIALTLWITVAAACAAATPTPLPTPTQESPEPLRIYKDIGYPVADVEKWLKVLQDINLDQHPGVVRIYTTNAGGFGGIKVIVSSKEHINPVLEQIELAGLSFNHAQVLVDNPWHQPAFLTAQP